MAFTSGNDINILQSSDTAVVGAGAGNDRYVLDASVLSANQRITISDTQGTNTLQLAGGLAIVSSRVTSNAVQLTLNNGAVVTVLGADTFSFQTGGNTLNGTGGTTQVFSDFVTASLGLAAVPAAGATPVSGAAVTVNEAGGTTAGGGAATTYALTASATEGYENGSVTYTVTASAPVASATNVVFTLVAGNTSAADQGTTTTNLNDFNSGSFNAQTVTIAAGQTTATFTVSALNDNKTELSETYSVKAVVAGQTLTANGTVLDGEGAGVGLTYLLTKDQNIIPGTAGNDTVNGLVNLAASVADASTTFNGFDQISGGAGVNTFKLAVSGAMTGGTPYTASLANIEKIQVVEINNTATGDTVKVDASAVADLTDLKVTKSTSAIELTGSDAQNITTAGTADAITVKGGKDVTVTDATAAKNITVSNSGATGNAAGAITVTDSKQAGGAIVVDGGTTVNVTATTDKATSGAITVGANKAASGAVTVTQNVTNDAAAAITAGNIAVTGGSTVTVNKNLTNTATKDSGAANNITAGTVTVTGDSKTTAVTVNQVNVANDYAAVTTGATAETSAITFASLKSGEKIAVSAAALTALGTDLTFTAGKDLTAAEVAAAFANLINGDKQTAGGKVANGVWTGSLDAGWTSGAVSGSTVTFTATTTGNQTNEITLTVKKADGTTNVDNLADFTTVKVDGSAGTSTTARDVTATMGNVTINDNATAAITDVTVNGYGTLVIGTTQELAKLANVSLANSGNTATIDGGAGVTALNLTVNNVQHAVDISTNSTAVKTLAVTATGANSTFGLTAANVETLTVAGDKVLDIDNGSTLTALKTVTVTGSAGLSIDATGLANQTSFTTTGTTGAVTATIDASKATYTGGEGVDTVTLTNAAVAKNIALGGGNDTLDASATSAANLGGTFTFDGGTGTNTLKLAAADAVALSGATTFEGKISNFQKLSLGNATAVGTVNLANLDDISHVITAGSVGGAKAEVQTFTVTNGAIGAGNIVIEGVNVAVTAGMTVDQVGAAIAAANYSATTIDTVTYNTGTDTVTVTYKAGVDEGDTTTVAGATGVTFGAVGTTTHGAATGGTAPALTLDKMANNGTVELTAIGAGVIVKMTDATGTADVLNIVTAELATVNVGTVTANGVETINITTTDPYVDANNNGIDDVLSAVTLAVVSDKVTKVNVTGAGDITLTAADTTLTEVDASTLEGILTFTATVNSLVVKGGTAADDLTANANDVALYGNGGGDTLTVAGGLRVNLYGGAGADKFVINTTASDALDSYTVINGVDSGDVISMASANKFSATKVTLSVGADQTLLNYANQAVNTLAANEMGWFQRDGNTYIVLDNGADSSAGFVADQDMIVMITGLVDLSTASYNSTSNTLEIA